MFGPLLFGWSCTESPAFSMKYWMLCLQIISNLLSLNGCRGHHRIALEGLGDKINTWRENGTWIYANHYDPYILMVNCGLPYHWEFCNEDLECSGFFVAPPQGEWNNVYKRGWRWSMCTRMVISHQSGSSIACHMWRIYMWTPSCSGYH